MTHQCEGVTADGYECQRDAAHGSRFCWQHGGRKVRRAPARRTRRAPARRVRRVYATRTPRRQRTTIRYSRGYSTPRIVIMRDRLRSGKETLKPTGKPISYRRGTKSAPMAKAASH